MEGNGHEPESNGRLRVVVCHGLPVMRSGLKAIIDAESDMVVVGETDDLGNALPLIEELKPRVIVAHLSLDGGAGLDAMRAVKNALPSVKILVIAYQGCGEFFPLAMRAGADAYLTREAEPSEVASAIRSVSRGQNYVDSSVVTLLVDTYVYRTRRGGLDDPYEVLSEREREIMCLAATGHTNKEIAGILHLSKQTVHNVRARVMEKLGLHDRMELLRFAIRRGIVSAQDI